MRNESALRSHGPRGFVLVASLLFLSSTLFAAELPTASPEQVGMNGETIAKITPVLQSFVDRGSISGAVAMVARHGKVVYFEAVGERVRESGKSLGRDSIFRIYSMTKPITSVAAMILVEEGKLDLDAPLEKWLPEFARVRVFNGMSGDSIEISELRRSITVRDLLRHTSGLTYGFFGNSEVDKLYRRANLLDRSGSLQQMVEALTEIPLLHQPGETWEYSVSTDVCGRLIEVASGSSLDEFFETRIFAPLGMVDSGFFVSKESVVRFTANYSPTPEGLQLRDVAEGGPYCEKPGLFSGGGGLVSTAEDYMRFCQMLLGRGQFEGRRVLRSETVDLMVSNQLVGSSYPIGFGGAPVPGVGFGLGFSVVVEAGEERPDRKGEYAWAGAASTHFWISPSHDLAGIVMTQIMPMTSEVQDAVKPLVYGSILAD